MAAQLAGRTWLGSPAVAGGDTGDDADAGAADARRPRWRRRSCRVAGPRALEFAGTPLMAMLLSTLLALLHVRDGLRLRSRPHPAVRRGSAAADRQRPARRRRRRRLRTRPRSRGRRHRHRTGDERTAAVAAGPRLADRVDCCAFGRIGDRGSRHRRRHHGADAAACPASTASCWSSRSAPARSSPPTSTRRVLAGEGVPEHDRAADARDLDGHRNHRINRGIGRGTGAERDCWMNALREVPRECQRARSARRAKGRRSFRLQAEVQGWPSVPGCPKCHGARRAKGVTVASAFRRKCKGAKGAAYEPRIGRCCGLGTGDWERTESGGAKRPSNQPQSPVQHQSVTDAGTGDRALPTGNWLLSYNSQNRNRMLNCTSRRESSLPVTRPKLAFVGSLLRRSGSGDSGS